MDASTLNVLGAIPVQARKLKNPVCVYVNRELLTERDAIEQFAFAVPSALESDDHYQLINKVFWAERYGGDGIGLNGGAGRCGTDGAFQIKGIGKTPLVAPHAELFDVWHAHGAVSLADAIQEAIWGEVYMQALPFGAARIAAIIATGTECIYEGLGGAKTKAPRALVVRQSTIRPAHFMRAVNFRPPSNLGLEPDVERVRRAVQFLPSMLPKPSGRVSSLPIEQFGLGLAEACVRWANQCATSQTRKLLHGAISPSNVALDGRWVDFGTSTALPTHANTKSYGAPLHFSTLWDEQRRFAPIVRDLCFFANKFLVPAATPAIDDLKFVAFFDQQYHYAFSMASLALLGVPSKFTSPLIGDSMIIDLGRAIAEIIRTGNEIRIESGTKDLSCFGHNHIGKVIVVLALFPWCGDRQDVLLRIIGSQAKVRRLIDLYRYLLSAITERMGAGVLSERAIRRLTMLAGLKASWCFDSLYRHNLVSANRASASSPLDWASSLSVIRDRILKVSFEASVIYAPHTDSIASIYRNLNTHAYFDALADRWTIDCGGRLRYFGTLRALCVELPEVAEFWQLHLSTVEHASEI